MTLLLEYPWLPIEIYIKILQKLPLDEEGSCTLARCSLASKSLYEASCSPLLWKPFYDNRYNVFNVEHEKTRRSRFGDDWRVLYLTRRGIEHKVLQLLNCVIQTTDYHARNEAARKIVEDHGLDVWDGLKAIISRPPPVLFQDDADVEKVKAGLPLINLTTRFWISEILGVIARRHTMELWAILGEANGQNMSEFNEPFEVALSGLASFWGVHPIEIQRKLDDLASGCKQYLRREQVAYEPTDDNFETSRLCTAVCRFMRMEGYDGVEDYRFFHIFNSFPNFFLFSRKHSLPMSLAFTFVSIVKRLGLPAIPIGTPARIITRVQNTYVDVFASPEHAILGESEDTYGNIFTKENQLFVAKGMLSRVGRNISHADSMMISDPRAYFQVTQSQRQQAWYAVRCISAMHIHLGHESRLSATIGELLELPHVHPLDLSLVVRDKILRSLSNNWEERHGNTITLNRCRGMVDHRESQCAEASMVMRRRREIVDFFVGQFLRMRGGEIGCVIGWTMREDNSEALSLKSVQGRDNHEMEIDGRPVYTIISFEDQTIHNDVVSQGFVPIQGKPIDFRPFLVYDMLGYYFKDAECYEVPNSGLVRSRFIMSDAMMQNYPDDEDYGSRWLRSSV